MLEIAQRATLDGIFRTSGNAEEIRRVMRMIDDGELEKIVFADRDPHLAPALLKQVVIMFICGCFICRFLWFLWFILCLTHNTTQHNKTFFQK